MTAADIKSQIRNGDGRYKHIDPHTKKCSRCECIFPRDTDYFHVDNHNFDGLRYMCKKCSLDKVRKPHKEETHKRCPDCGCIYPKTDEYFYKIKKGRLLSCYCKKCSKKRSNKWIEDNPDKVSKIRKRANDKFKKENPEWVKEWRKNRDDFMYNNDIGFKIKRILSQRLRHALMGLSKDSTTLATLGCSITYFISYIESLFKDGMSWDNYGRGEGRWVFDHIRPCASFDLTDPQQQKECFHYTNIRPLWDKENMKKSSIYNGVRIAKKRIKTENNE